MLLISLFFLSLPPSTVLTDEKLQCNNTVTSAMASTAVLHCRFQCENLHISSTSWIKDGKPVVSYKLEGNQLTDSDHFHFRQQQWNNTMKDVSLQINHVTEDDNGQYVFCVISSCGMCETTVNLTVQAASTRPPYASPLTGERVLSSGTCLSSSVLSVKRSTEERFGGDRSLSPAASTRPPYASPLTGERAKKEELKNTPQKAGKRFFLPLIVVAILLSSALATTVFMRIKRAKKLGGSIYYYQTQNYSTSQEVVPASPGQGTLDPEV